MLLYRYIKCYYTDTYNAALKKLTMLLYRY
jgi:hypothetical protein